MKNCLSLLELLCFGMLACAFFFVQGCASSNDQETKTSESKDSDQDSKENAHSYFHKSEKEPAAHWSYEGETGPSHWGDLSSAYVLAKTGKEQSPINITDGIKEETPSIQFDYKPATINLVYNGHTVEETDDNGSSITVAGRSFPLKQFHFHAPSEHAVNGESFAMEMHLVHKNAANQVAVVGVLVKEGAENKAFNNLWNYLPTEENKRLTNEVTVDVSALLPKEHGYYHYMGSFTTPPCTQGVYWYILEEPIELSAGQIDQFKAIISGNNRPTQPLNGRKIAETGK